MWRNNVAADPKGQQSTQTNKWMQLCETSHNYQSVADVMLFMMTEKKRTGYRVGCVCEIQYNTSCSPSAEMSNCLQHQAMTSYIRSINLRLYCHLRALGITKKMHSKRMEKILQCSSTGEILQQLVGNRARYLRKQAYQYKNIINITAKKRARQKVFFILNT